MITPLWEDYWGDFNRIPVMEFNRPFPYVAKKPFAISFAKLWIEVKPHASITRYCFYKYTSINKNH